MSDAEKGFQLAYKFRAYPTAEQAAFLDRNFGACRFVYNYYLQARIEAYERTKPIARLREKDENGEYLLDGNGRYVYAVEKDCAGEPIKGDDGRVVYIMGENPDYDPLAKPMSLFDTTKDLTRLKKELVDDEGKAWLKDADAVSLLYSLRNLDAAFQGFFRRAKKGSGATGFPKFKKKTFAASYKTSCSNDKVMREGFRGGYVILPKVGKMKTRIHREVAGSVYAAAVSRTASGEYYVTLCVKEAEIEPLPPAEGAVGIALGTLNWCVTTDGEVFDRPNQDEELYRKLAKEQRKLSRMQGARPGEQKSNRYLKQQRKVAKISQKIANKRAYETHKLTHHIVSEYDTIVSREYDVASMTSPKRDKALDDNTSLPRKAQSKVARHLLDANIAEVNRQLAYKSEWNGRDFIMVPKDALTAQICSSCGERNIHVAKYMLQDWTCAFCKTHHERKANGAANILELGLEIANERNGDDSSDSALQ